MAPSSPLSVVAADDHPLFRAGLARAIRDHPGLRLAAEVEDGRTALAAIRRVRPDVAVLDLRMPGLDGLGVLNAIVCDRIPTKVMLLSGWLNEQHVRRAQSLGAAAVLSKRLEGTDVIQAIVAVGRGERIVDAAAPLGRADDPRFEHDATRPLSPRESQVLRLLADGRSGPDIARELIVSLSTVKSHIQNIYEKLGVSQRGAAVAEGMRRGILE